jgi:phenylalanyl-tRNA synthetase beta chain
MRISLAWLRELVDLPAAETGRDVAERLINAGLEVETVELVGAGLNGPITVGRVQQIEELTEFKKPIRWCQVDTGEGQPRGIICGARNFVEGDLVVVAPPGTTLPGDFTITARETYGHVSDGMICSERELGLGEDHAGIIVLPPHTAEPGADAADILGAGDEVLDIAITPDRGYALSARGIAREVAITYHLPFSDPVDRPETLPAPHQGGAPAHCASDDLQACPLFTLRTITGIDPSVPTPQWMVNRLRDSGMRSVSLAVDITNYVMLELGQPLHAFDLDSLQGTVRVGRALPGEKLETIDHVERELSADDLTIRDDRGPIGLAGTMGGAHTEIGDDTTNIALEAAYFAADVVARMGRRHKLSSEASRRFERGIDRTLAPIASARASELLVELAGGTYQGMTAVEAPMDERAIEISADLPAQVAGMDIDAATTVAKLTAVGCAVEENEEPAERHPTHVATGPHRSRRLWSRKSCAWSATKICRQPCPPRPPATGSPTPSGCAVAWAPCLQPAAWSRCSPTRSPATPMRTHCVGTTTTPAARHQDSLTRCPTSNRCCARQSCPPCSAPPSATWAAASTISRLFELGSVFLGVAGSGSSPQNPPRPGVTQQPSDADWRALEGLLPDQPTHLAAVWTGDRSPKGWRGGGEPVTWADAIATVQDIADSLGVELIIERGSDPAFHPGRCAQLTIDNAVIGHAGELHPGVLEAWGLPERACAMELDLDALMQRAPLVHPAPDFSTHPVAKEDIALVVAENVTASQLEQAIRGGAGELLEDVTLFDVYTGDQVPEGHKSLAFALRFRALDRTLAAEEIATARQGAITAAEELGARLR